MPNDEKQNETCVSSNLEPYLAKDGDAHPYASLLTDLTFKKAFNPDNETSRKTLVAMLNDILGPQLVSPIKSVRTRNVEQNASGSGVSRTAIFDLHCEDDKGELIEIEVQIRKMTALLLSCKISRLNREEFQEYRKVYHAVFDHNAMREGFFEEFAEEINQKVEEASLAKAREMAKRMLAKSRPISEIVEFTGLTKEEILAL